MSEEQPSTLRPTIARIWRGRVRAERADDYEAYYMDALPQLAHAALGVQTLRQQRGDEVEFVTISYWEDVAAMSRFAGDDPKRIVRCADVGSDGSGLAGTVDQCADGGVEAVADRHYARVGFTGA